MIRISRTQQKSQNFPLEINLLYSTYNGILSFFILNSFTCRCSCGGIYKINSNNVLSSVFFQKQSWQNMYARYPELILIDATYKLNNLRMPMYILMVVDGNGESEIIALWLVVYEDKDTISHLMDIFVKHNDTANTKCIMAVCRYASTEVRNHLVTCFENGHMTSFPSSAVKKKKALMKQVNVYYQCRLPYVLEHMKNPGNEVVVMVQCYICDNLYHFSCKFGSSKEDKKNKRNVDVRL